MCRNIHTLYNFDPPATQAEVHDAALQYVRKISGYNKPSEVNLAAFDQAVAEVSRVTAKLLDSLVTTAPKKDRAEEHRKAHERALKRFGTA